MGECYILANETVTLKDMCDMLHQECNAKKIKFYLPLDLAGKIAQGLEKQAAKTGKKPLMTTFSVYNLARNNEFDYSKAQRELGYTTRPYQQTIHDEVQWFVDKGLIEGAPTPANLTNEEIRESGVMAHMIQAMEHNPMDIPGVDPTEAYKAVEQSVAGAYKTVEEGVVGVYKAVEKSAVDAYHKVEDAMVDKLFRKEGESVEEAKERLRKQ